MLLHLLARVAAQLAARATPAVLLARLVDTALGRIHCAHTLAHGHHHVIGQRLKRVRSLIVLVAEAHVVVLAVPARGRTTLAARRGLGALVHQLVIRVLLHHLQQLDEREVGLRVCRLGDAFDVAAAHHAAELHRASHPQLIVDALGAECVRAGREDARVAITLCAGEALRADPAFQLAARCRGGARRRGGRCSHEGNAECSDAAARGTPRIVVQRRL